MSLALDPILATAQDSESRRPLVDIISTQAVDYIPFDGQWLADSGELDQKPNMITHSTGRLCVVYTQGSGLLVLGVTDVERLEFDFYSAVTAAAGFSLQEAAICELANGHLGLVYHEIETGVEQTLKWAEFTLAGAMVASGTIVTYPVTDWVNAPSVVHLSEGYGLVFAYRTSGAYSIRMTGTGDFATWPEPFAPSIAGLNPARRVDHPFIVETSPTETFLWFDYVSDIINDFEVMNVYYSITPDGSTWGAAAQLTAYSDVIAVGLHPVAIQQVADQQVVVYTEQRGALLKDADDHYPDAGWCGTGSLRSSVVDLSWDSVHRKLYAVCVDSAPGTTSLMCVVRIDVDTWTVDACWDATTTPRFDQAFFENNAGLGRNYGGREFVPVGIFNNGSQRHVALLDGHNDRIVTYSFTSWQLYGLTANVNGAPLGLPSSPAALTLYYTFVDPDNRRLYLCFSSVGRMLEIGYIDLTQTEEPYDYHSVWREVERLSEYEYGGVQAGDFIVVPGQGIIIMSLAYATTGYSFYTGRVIVINIASGAIQSEYYYQAGPENHFPMHGLTDITYANGKVWGCFTYESGFSEEEKRGLCEIDLETDEVTLHRPTWDLLDDYGLRRMCATEDGHIVITTDGHGITVYDPVGDSWLQHTSQSIPGLDPHGNDIFYPVVYDSLTGLVMVGAKWEFVFGLLWMGVAAINRYGLIRRTYYREGLYAAGWSFGAAASFIEGLTDYEAVVSLHPVDKTFYAVWTNQHLTDLGIKWDAEGDLAITPFLLGSVSVRGSIENTPARLSFEVARGHLFDPNNTHSLLATYLEKGRELQLRFGERVGPTDYWQAQGKFYVTALKVSYSKGAYPTAKVEAEDFRTFFIDQKVITTDDFVGEWPEDVLLSVMEQHSNLEPADIVIPLMDESCLIDIQWVEENLTDIINQICDRWLYYPVMDVDGVFRLRRVSSSNLLDHSYIGLTKIINFTPDDRFSDFVNRVIVEGEERTFTEVLHSEERVDQMNGTVGFWGCDDTFDRPYSPDWQKRCRSPRLHVITSATSIAFDLAGSITETLTANDDYSCSVYISVPNLTPALIGFLSSAMESLFIGDTVVTAGFIASGGYTIRIGSMLSCLLLASAMFIVSSIANYQYEIYAYPVGEVRNMVTATADDEELQAKIGAIVQKKIKDPLVYTYDQAMFVARSELELLQLQRRRVKFTKLAHLQDEVGDTIEIPHPYSGETMRIFITDLTRTMTFPKGKSGGTFTDEIEGWKL